MEKNTRQKKNSDVEIGLIIASVAILVAFIILMIVNPDGTLNAITKFFNMMIIGLGPFFEIIAFVSFIVGLYFCFGKYGKVRLGNCKPEYSNFSYFSMMLLASLASAALYWSFTEWASYYQAPGLGIIPESVEAVPSFPWDTSSSTGALSTSPCIPLWVWQLPTVFMYVRCLPSRQVRFAAQCWGIR